MSCDKTKERLAAYLEGLLEPAEAEEVARHVSECAACRAEEARHRAVWELLAADEPVEAPSGLASKVLEQARGREAPEGAEVVRLKSLRRWAAPALAAAAVVVVVLGAWLLQRGSGGEPSLARLSEEERQVVAHLDLLEEFDLLEHLEMMENLELIEHQEVVKNL